MGSLTISEQLKQRFPWLGTDDEAGGADTVEALADWYEEVLGKAPVDGEKAPASHIEFTTWRELFDDEDNMQVEVFAGGDSTPITDLISQEYSNEGEEPLTFDYDDQSSVKHPCTTTNGYVLNDGDVLTSHDGRKFLVSITEVSHA